MLEQSRFPTMDGRNNRDTHPRDDTEPPPPLIQCCCFYICWIIFDEQLAHRSTLKEGVRGWVITFWWVSRLFFPSMDSDWRQIPVANNNVFKFSVSKTVVFIASLTTPLSQISGFQKAREWRSQHAGVEQLVFELFPQNTNTNRSPCNPPAVLHKDGDLIRFSYLRLS